MKMNLRVFKRGKPIYWIIGAVVIFAIFYMLANKGSKGAASGTTLVASGPSDAVTIAGLQASTGLQGAQIAAGVQIAGIQEQQNEATLGAQVALANIAASSVVAQQQLDTQQAMAETQAATAQAINADNNSAAIANATIASNTETTINAQQIGLLTHQLDVQNEMFTTQTKTLIDQSLIAQIPSLKQSDRDNAVQILAAGFGTGNVTYNGGQVYAGGVTPPYPTLH